MIAATDTQLMATGRRDTLRLVLTVLLGAAGAATGTVAAAAQAIRVEVWKDPSCGCCDGWIRHLRAAGFEVVVQEVVDVRPLKTAHEVPEELWSCHTAAVGGYLVEGHVPASDIYRLLAERPAARASRRPGCRPPRRAWICLARRMRWWPSGRRKARRQAAAGFGPGTKQLAGLPLRPLRLARLCNGLAQVRSQRWQLSAQMRQCSCMPTWCSISTNA
ncbi:DUF411 domain-containing protein [Paeniroseomonas aquatica]|uniref:DUF411 domain-containing protein n=1 Tax=Paeniroseomonas aquatica TaxID=373043 RepID=UPI00361F08F1